MKIKYDPILGKLREDDGGSTCAATVVVADITARDALTDLTVGNECWVVDATDDETVETGAAKYLWDGTAWIKTAEAESMDVVLDWANVQNKPELMDATAVKKIATKQALIFG